MKSIHFLLLVWCYLGNVLSSIGETHNLNVVASENLDGKVELSTIDLLPTDPTMLPNYGNTEKVYHPRRVTVRKHLFKRPLQIKPNDSMDVNKSQDDSRKNFTSVTDVPVSDVELMNDPTTDKAFIHFRKRIDRTTHANKEEFLGFTELHRTTTEASIHTDENNNRKRTYSFRKFAKRVFKRPHNTVKEESLGLPPTSTEAFIYSVNNNNNNNDRKITNRFRTLSKGVFKRPHNSFTPVKSDVEKKEEFLINTELPPTTVSSSTYPDENNNNEKYMPYGFGKVSNKVVEKTYMTNMSANSNIYKEEFLKPTELPHTITEASIYPHENNNNRRITHRFGKVSTNISERLLNTTTLVDSDVKKEEFLESTEIPHTTTEASIYPDESNNNREITHRFGKVSKDVFDRPHNTVTPVNSSIKKEVENNNNERDMPYGFGKLSNKVIVSPYMTNMSANSNIDKGGVHSLEINTPDLFAKTDSEADESLFEHIGSTEENIFNLNNQDYITEFPIDLDQLDFGLNFFENMEGLKVVNPFEESLMNAMRDFDLQANNSTESSSTLSNSTEIIQIGLPDIIDNSEKESTSSLNELIESDKVLVKENTPTTEKYKESTFKTNQEQFSASEIHLSDRFRTVTEPSLSFTIVNTDEIVQNFENIVHTSQESQNETNTTEGNIKNNNMERSKVKDGLEETTIPSMRVIDLQTDINIPNQTITPNVLNELPHIISTQKVITSSTMKSTITDSVNVLINDTKSLLTPLDRTEVNTEQYNEGELLKNTISNSTKINPNVEFNTDGKTSNKVFNLSDSGFVEVPITITENTEFIGNGSKKLTASVILENDTNERRIEGNNNKNNMEGSKVVDALEEITIPTMTVIDLQTDNNISNQTTTPHIVSTQRAITSSTMKSKTESDVLIKEIKPLLKPLDKTDVNTEQYNEGELLETTTFSNSTKINPNVTSSKKLTAGVNLKNDTNESRIEGNINNNNMESQKVKDVDLQTDIHFPTKYVTPDPSNIERESTSSTIKNKITEPDEKPLATPLTYVSTESYNESHSKLISEQKIKEPQIKLSSKFGIDTLTDGSSYVTDSAVAQENNLKNVIRTSQEIQNRTNNSDDSSTFNSITNMDIVNKIKEIFTNDSKLLGNSTTDLLYIKEEKELLENTTSNVSHMNPNVTHKDINDNFEQTLTNQSKLLSKSRMNTMNMMEEKNILENGTSSNFSHMNPNVTHKDISDKFEQTFTNQSKLLSNSTMNTLNMMEEKNILDSGTSSNFTNMNPDVTHNDINDKLEQTLTNQSKLLRNVTTNSLNIMEEKNILENGTISNLTNLNPNVTHKDISDNFEHTLTNQSKLLSNSTMNPLNMMEEKNILENGTISNLTNMNPDITHKDINNKFEQILTNQSKLLSNSTMNTLNMMEEKNILENGTISNFTTHTESGLNSETSNKVLNSTVAAPIIIFSINIVPESTLADYPKSNNSSEKLTLRVNSKNETIQNSIPVEHITTQTVSDIDLQTQSITPVPSNYPRLLENELSNTGKMSTPGSTEGTVTESDNISIKEQNPPSKILDGKYPNTDIYNESDSRIYNEQRLKKQDTNLSTKFTTDTIPRVSLNVTNIANTSYEIQNGINITDTNLSINIVPESTLADYPKSINNSSERFTLRVNSKNETIQNNTEGIIDKNNLEGFEVVDPEQITNQTLRDIDLQTDNIPTQSITPVPPNYPLLLENELSNTGKVSTPSLTESTITKLDNISIKEQNPPSKVLDEKYPNTDKYNESDSRMYSEEKLKKSENNLYTKFATDTIPELASDVTNTANASYEIPNGSNITDPNIKNRFEHTVNNQSEFSSNSTIASRNVLNEKQLLLGNNSISNITNIHINDNNSSDPKVVPITIAESTVKDHPKFISNNSNDLIEDKRKLAVTESKNITASEQIPATLNNANKLLDLDQVERPTSKIHVKGNNVTKLISNSNGNEPENVDEVKLKTTSEKEPTVSTSIPKVDEDKTIEEDTKHLSQLMKNISFEINSILMEVSHKRNKSDEEIATTIIPEDFKVTLSKSGDEPRNASLKNINPISYIQRNILGHDANFSIGLTFKETQFYIPVDVYIIENLGNLSINFTWMNSINSRINNSLTIFLTSISNQYLISGVELNIIKLETISTWSKYNVFLPNKNEETGQMECFIKLEDGIDIHFSNIDFLWTEDSEIKQKGSDLSQTEAESGEFYIHLLVGLLSILVFSIIGIYVVIIKRKHRSVEFKNMYATA